MGDHIKKEGSAKLKIINNTLCILTTCHICHRKRWMDYFKKSGYVCSSCIRKSAPYFYIRCNKCGRLFYSTSSLTKTCIKCVYCLRRPKRRRFAIRFDRLLNGEIFYVLEYPNTLFMKWDNKIVYHSGKRGYVLDVIKNSYYIYKYKY